MYIDFIPTNILIILATAFAIKPKVIRRIGPTPATATVNIVKNFLLPSPRLLNLSRIFPTNSTIGVKAFKNCSPTGAIANFKSSIDFLNLYVVVFCILSNSRCDKIASSSVVACVSCSTLFACVPCAVTF